MTAEEEVQAGLINAVERGVPLEKAVQTFINAGYPESAVRSAARVLNEGNVPVAEVKTPSVEYKQQIDSPPIQNAPQMEKPKEEGVSKSKIIILVGILVLLLIILGVSFIYLR